MTEPSRTIILDSTLARLRRVEEAAIKAHQLLGGLRGADLPNKDARERTIGAYGHLDWALAPSSEEGT